MTFLPRESTAVVAGRGSRKEEGTERVSQSFNEHEGEVDEGEVGEMGEDEERDLRTERLGTRTAEMRAEMATIARDEGSVGNGTSSSESGAGSRVTGSVPSASINSASLERESAKLFSFPGVNSQSKSNSERVSHKRTCRLVCFGGWVL
jgi:hypothetical protein